MTSNEATPLLSSATGPHEDLPKPISSLQHSSWSWTSVVALCIAIAITADVAEYLSLAPKVRLFESIICTDYYRQTSPSLITQRGSIPEHLCKVGPVQDSVASILGWQVFFESIPAILLPIPYGYLADTYGRKWIAVLAILSYALSWAYNLFVIGVLRLPLQYVWFSPLFFLIGGGPPMATTLITTIVADVAPADKRSAAFFYRFTSELIAECLVPPITAILMAKTPWIPLLIGLALLVFCTMMTIALPETLSFQQNEDPDPASQIEESQSLTESSTLAAGKGPSWRIQIRQIKQSFSFAIHNWTITALIFTFLVSKIGRQSIDLLLQYVSKRYGWSLSKAGLLLCLRAAINILLFTIILPYIATCTFRKYKITPENSPASRNLAIARGSTVLMVLGTLTLSVSFTPGLMIVGLTLYTLGTGAPLVLRSLITTLVETSHIDHIHTQQHIQPRSESTNHAHNNPLLSSPSPLKTSPTILPSQPTPIARLYALLQLTEGLGNLLAGPGMAWLFRVGIKLSEVGPGPGPGPGPGHGHGRGQERDAWLGLPFLVASLLFGLVGGIVFAVRIGSRDYFLWTG